MKKYLNMYTFIAFTACAILPILSWGLSSGVIRCLINNTRTERGGSQAEFILSWGFSSYMIESFSILQLVLPLLAILLSFGFVRLCKGYYSNAKPRTKRFSAFVCKDILRFSLSASAALYLGFLLFCLFGAVTHPIVTDENYSRSFLNDVFGEGFAWKNPLVYYLLEGVYKYAVFPFAYCFFASSVYLFFGKSYTSIIVPTGYYIAMSVLMGTLRSPLYGTIAGDFLQALRPSNMLMMGAESGNVPVLYPLISLIPPITASIIFFIKGIQNEKKSG